jgi:hypothetical protein
VSKARVDTGRGNSFTPGGGKATRATWQVGKEGQQENCRGIEQGDDGVAQCDSPADESLVLGRR